MPKFELGPDSGYQTKAHLERARLLRDPHRSQNVGCPPQILV